MVKLLDRFINKLAAPETDNKPSLLDRANDPSVPLARGSEEHFDSRSAEQIAKEKAAGMVAAAALRGASESDTPVPASPEVVDFAAQNGEPSVAPVEQPQLPPTEEPRQQ